ncbi:MAG: DUF4114 domain-containing protein [Proteobacteria bacterium]|nr:DUF4114 domain-containing protein [Pseudomonadota bacterium]
MANTVMNVALSDAYKTTLTQGGSGNGIYAWAFAFDTPSANAPAGKVAQVELVTNGVAAVNPQLNLTQGDGTFLSGTVYFVVQQTAGTAIAPLDPSTITQPGSLYFEDAIARNYRYDVVEATISNAPADVADITSIVQFGSTLSISANGVTRGYNTSAADIYAALQTNLPAGTEHYTFAGTPLNQLREALLAGSNLPNNPANVSADWAAYVTKFQGIADQVYLASYFNGVAAKDGNPAVPPSLSYYGVSYDSARDMFWLTPETMTGVATTQGVIGITSTELQQNIYAQTGTLNIYANKGDANPTQTFNTFTPNNAWGDITKYFVAGFDAGYWGGKANSPNPTIKETISFNKTWNWDAPYSYAAINAPAGTNNYGYTNTLGTGTGTPGPDRQMFYDPLAATFVKAGNAYGYSYSDLLSTGGTNPQISLWNGTANVSSIDVTLFDFNETPTGYVPQPGVPYIAGALPIPTTTQSTNTFIFDMSVAGTFAPKAGTPITFGMYAPGAAHTDSKGFIRFDVSSSGTTDYGYYYHIVPDATLGWKLDATNPYTATGGFAISNVFMPSPGDTGWYQLTIGSGTLGKTYNMYVQGTDSTITTAEIDGGASAAITPSNTAKFSTNGGGTAITYDPIYFSTATPTPPPPPKNLDAPQVGFDQGGTFVPIADPTNMLLGSLAFSSTPGSSNLLPPGNIAELKIADLGNASWIMTPIVAQAAAGGDWHTAMSTQFGNGSYSAYMQQYLPQDWGLTTPVGEATKLVDFSVNLATLPLVAADGGTALALTPGAPGSTNGNWIDLTVASSTLKNGTLIAYATDAGGNMLNRDGSGTTTSLVDATLAKIGAVAADNGQMFFTGQQSVYLPAGDNLKFAIVTGDDLVNLTPTTTVTGNGTLAVTVAGSGGQINFTATVDNTLSESAVLAASQRTTDHAWVYLTQGSQVQVDLAWSGYYTNTVHFVRMDQNPADAAQLQVGGVAYGNTDAFREAMAQHWEFSSTQGNSTGTSSATWTVGGGSGYYAPVLVNPYGNMFTIDATPNLTANPDNTTHVRMFGQNTFGFEDMSAGTPGVDFDYNDMIVKLSLLS